MQYFDKHNFSLNKNIQIIESFVNIYQIILCIFHKKVSFYSKFTRSELNITSYFSIICFHFKTLFVLKKQAIPQRNRLLIFIQKGAIALGDKLLSSIFRPVSPLEERQNILTIFVLIRNFIHYLFHHKDSKTADFTFFQR